jgi:cytochrome c
MKTLSTEFPLKRMMLVVLMLSMGSTIACAQRAPREPHRFDVLVFSKTAAFRHGSITDGVRAIQGLGLEHNFSVSHSEDSGIFNPQELDRFEVVVFLSTTGDVLDEAQQQAFEQYIEQGGGYAGVHAASDTEYDWPWYGELVGAWFAGHPPGTPTATVVTEDSQHVSTSHLPARWERVDEWYNYKTNPRSNVHVLLTLDETTYEGGTMNGDHPIAWVQEVGAGRVFYTGLGHTRESFMEPLFLQHLLAGIEWAAGAVQP